MDHAAAVDRSQDTHSCGGKTTYVRSNWRMHSGSAWQRRIGLSLPAEEPEVDGEGREELAAKADG